MIRALLQEGLSSIVFHRTTLDATQKILRDNKLMTSVAFGTEADRRINKGYPYYFSVMRSSLGNYSKGPVTLRLDGRKLGEQNKAFAIDYWQFPDQAKNEMEDRIVTNKPYIDPASKYILDIHVHVSVTGRKLMPHIIEAMEEISKNKEGIPVYFYPEGGWNTKQIPKPHKGMSFEEWKRLFDQEGDLDEPWDYKSRPHKGWYASDVANIIQALDRGDVSDIPKDSKTTWYRIKYDWSGDFARSLAADIHNNKSNSDARSYLDVIAQKMRRDKIKNTQELVAYLQSEIGGDA